MNWAVVALLSNLVTQSSDRVVLDEHFSDNRRDWPLSDKSSTMMAVRGGRYIFEHRRAERAWLVTKEARINDDEDFTIEVQLEKQTGPQKWGYGLVFGHYNSDNYLHFKITGNSHYRFGYTLKGDQKEVLGWTKTSVIRSGNGARNTIRVERRGDWYRFYINGQYMNRAEALPFFGQRIGFVIDHDQRIAVDRLFVTEQTTFYPPNGPQRGNPILTEEFYNNNRGWSQRSSSSDRKSIRSGRYVVERKVPRDATVTYISTSLRDDRDFAIEAPVTKVSGPQKWGYGITFGARDSRNGFRYIVSGNGQYMFTLWKDGVFRALIPWTKSSAIRQGNGATNVLRVEKRGTRWLLFINGRYINRVRARPFFGSNVGFSVSNQQIIEVERLELSDLSGNAPPPRVTMREPPPPPPIQVTPPPPPPPIQTTPREPMIVAVLDVIDSSGKLKRRDLRQLTEYLEVLLTKNGYAVVPRSEIRARLKEAKSESYKACYEESCQIELGKAVAAQAVLTTKLLRIGDQCALTATMFDLRKETTAKAALSETHCKVGELMKAVNDVASQL